LTNITVSAEIAQFEHQDLKLDQVLVASMPTKKIEKFVDPFVYDPNLNEDEEGGGAAEAQAPPA